MNYKTLLWGASITLTLPACTAIHQFSSQNLQNYHSPAQVIQQLHLNQNDGSPKEYVYYWDPAQGQQPVQSLQPKNYLHSFCQAKGGQLKLLHKSSMRQVQASWSRKLLSTYSNVQQGIGAFQCLQKDGQSWIVSIEPSAERKQGNNETRVVALLSKVMSPAEVVQFYGQNQSSTASLYGQNNRGQNAVLNQKQDERKLAEKKLEDKKAEEKRKADEKRKNEELKKAEELKARKQAELAQIADTPQMQQMKLYVEARKGLSRGQNQFEACNTAERAYQYGRLRGASGINAYAESGVLVARCLISVPAYSRRYSQPKQRAIQILQPLAQNYNHTGARQMLLQIK